MRYILLFTVFVILVPLSSLVFAIDDQNLEDLVRKADGIAELRVEFDKDDYTKNSYTFKKWFLPLAKGKQLAKKWAYDCLPTRSRIESQIEQITAEGGGESLRKALKNNGYSLIVFLKGTNKEGDVYLWCEGRTIISGNSWLSDEDFPDWFKRFENLVDKRLY